jgi:hypothetical protein
MAKITYNLSNGKKVHLSRILGGTGYVKGGKLILSHSPIINDFKEAVESATRISLDGKIEGLTTGSYSSHLIIERKGREPLTAWVSSEEVTNVVISKPREGFDRCHADAFKAQSRPSVKGEPIKQGSVIKFKAGTAVGARKWKRDQLEADTLVMVTTPFEGRAINPDGTLGDGLNLTSHLEGIISGYALVHDTEGLEVISLGSREIMYSASMCL